MENYFRSLFPDTKELNLRLSFVPEVAHKMIIWFSRYVLNVSSIHCYFLGLISSVVTLQSFAYDETRQLKRAKALSPHEDHMRYLFHDVYKFKSKQALLRFMLTCVAGTVSVLSDHSSHLNVIVTTIVQYDAGVLGGVLLHPPFLDAIGNPKRVYVIPMIVASYDLAACITAVGISPFTFKNGRRGTVILGNIAAVVGSVIQTSSYSVSQLIVGRLCTGFAIGCISIAVPTYLNETGIEIGDRGPANAFNAILLISGVPLAYWIDYGFTMMNNQASWRVPIIFQCIFAFVSGGTMWFLPDTPRWYYARNRFEEGDAVLAQLNDTDVDSEKVQYTRCEILAAIESELEASASLSWKDFLTMGIVDKTRMKIIRRICMCSWLPMIREWMGSSLIAYYSKYSFNYTPQAHLKHV